MKIVLATGIYPPQIGGPATYTKALAEKLANSGHEITVVTYGEVEKDEKWNVETVSRSIPIIRWWWYSQRLREVGADADIVYAFSSISCGVPLVLAGLKKPKKVLRLGGDFLWERYTDFGGKKSLRMFYESPYVAGKWMMTRLLNRFDHIVFSTEFQQKIYETHYRRLPKHSVLENALEVESGKWKVESVTSPHTPFRLLFMGRTVQFKNILSLIDAVAQIPDCFLTIVGEGPQDDMLRKKVEHLGLHTRVQFSVSVSGTEKRDMFASHDLLVLPSYTDISPNTALEARAAGLPVLLTKETGLSSTLLKGMTLAELQRPGDIVLAIAHARETYAAMCFSLKGALEERSWTAVSEQHEALFVSL
jgi:glycosyltransferase involved in cell wall biosynthesis